MLSPLRIKKQHNPMMLIKRVHNSDSLLDDDEDAKTRYTRQQGGSKIDNETSYSFSLKLNVILSFLLACLFSQFAVVVVVGQRVGFLGNPFHDPSIILPDDNYAGNITQDLEMRSNLIDHRRFIESMTTRCFSSTLMDDPSLFEPIFYVFKPGSETRLRASSGLQEILVAGFQPKQITYIFVHGFTQSYPDTPWLRHARALFERNLLTDQYNPIIMDWSRGAHQKFSQSAAIVSGMGAYLATFLNKLLELGLHRHQIHLVCHSLGAHVCGFAGKRIRPRIGRITALDMAGPCFGKVASNGPTDRLTPDDAIEVDVYHYDDDFLGIGPGQYGQHDVYVNGGSGQPGCQTQANAMLNAAVTVLLNRNRVLSESHTRSTEVATAQLADKRCTPMAYTCRTWAAFTQGECGFCDEHNNQCFFMGFPFQYGRTPNLPSIPHLRTAFPGKKYYISTSGGESFCQQHYQILIKLEQTPHLKKEPDYKFELEFMNINAGKLGKVMVSNRMAPGLYSYLLLVDGPPVKMEAASLKALGGPGLVPKLSAPILELAGNEIDQVDEDQSLKIMQVEVNFMSHVSPIVRSELSSRLCVVRLVAESDGSSTLQLAECRGVRGSLI